MKSPRLLLSLLFSAASVMGVFSTASVLAQPITAANDGTGTNVTLNGNRFDIQGGKLSNDGANLFHSFSQFDLNAGQTANFQSTSTTQNILGRVVSGKASTINGLIQVSGSQANLYLMNPSGIIFGANASLNVPASFVATTATSIGIGNNWFNAAGSNDYTQLNGTPNGFAFTTTQPGSIVNSGNLAVGAGNELRLLGGTVVNTGQLNAPSGQITMAAVPGTSLIRLSQPGSVLSLEVLPPASTSNSPTQWTLPVLSLPQLLTGGGGGNATGLSVNASGQAVLTGSNIIIENGDVVAKNVTAQEATLTANHNLTLVDSTLTTTGNLNLLAQDTVRMRDSVTSPVIAQAGGKLLIQGNQKIDIFALNNPASGLFSGGDMVLRSTNTVGGDAHYFSGGNFRIETLDGSLGNLFSPDDPVIRASGDVNFASYTGASLHILAGGSVTITGNVTITGVDATNGLAENVTLSDGTVLAVNGTTQPTLDIRAGTTAFGTPGIIGGGTFTPGVPGTVGTPTSANITIGSITMAPTGLVFLTNQYSPNATLPGGAIQVGTISAGNSLGLDGGSIVVDARSNILSTGRFDAYADSILPANSGKGGNITLLAGGDITFTTNDIDTHSSFGTNAGGNVTLKAGGNINLLNISTFGAGGSGNIILTGTGDININGTVGINASATNGSGGNITLSSTGGAINTTGGLNSNSSNGNGGAIALSAPGNITISSTNSSGNLGGGSITVNSTAGAITATGTLDSSSTAGNGGAIALSAGGNISAGIVDSNSGGSGSKGGDININAGGNFTAFTLVSVWQGTTTGNGGDITVNAGGDISSQGDFLSFTNNGAGGNITLTAGGNIFTDDIYSIGSLSSGEIKLTSGGTINTSFFGGTPGLISSCSGTANTCSGGTGRGGNITVVAATRIATRINANGPLGGGDISLISNEIDLGGTTSNGGTLLLQAFTPSLNIAIGGATDSGTGTLDITAADLAALQNGFNSITIGGADSSSAISILNSVTFNDPVTIQAPQGAGTISATGAITGLDNASITLRANQNITTSNITANPGITIISSNGEIDTSAGILDSSSTTGNGGAIALSALGNITTNNITSHSDTAAGGDITLNSQTGAVSSGNLDASGNTRGGNITVIAQQQITTGQLNSSATTGDGGNVLLDPIGDIQVDSIDAQGGTSGKGGNVDITTNQFFRAVGSFSDRNGINASISTVGGSSGGNITIRHGGNGVTPFIVGNASTNGTAGAITTGNFTIAPVQSLPYTYTLGNIQIISVNPPPQPTPPPTSTPPIDPPQSPSISPGIATDFVQLPEQPTTPSTPGELPDVTVDPIVAQLEQTFTSTYQNYMGDSNPSNSTTTTVSLPEAQFQLQQIEKATGIKPALIYAFFVPTSVPSQTPAAGTSQFVHPNQVGTQRLAPRHQRNKSQPEKSHESPQVLWQFNSSGLTTTTSPTLGQPYPPQDSDQLELVLVTSSGKPIQRRVTGATRKLVLEMTNKLRAETTEPRKQRATSYLPLAQQLYQWLVTPLEKDLQAQQINNLVFIMDTGLRSLPLAVLHNGSGFVVERYSVGLMPSVSLSDTRYVNVKNTKVLAMGASQFTEQNPLPATSTELSVISEQLWSGKSFLNDAFTLDNLKGARAAQPFGIIHLATHADFKPGQPSNSYIQLWGNDKLRLDQLRQLGWNNPPVELLVLSACRTALGDKEAELGFTGLATLSGVKTALGSLWYVSDEGTLGLMSEFYEQLKQAPIKAEALRQAQLAMIQGKVRLSGGKLITSQGSFPLPPELAEHGDKILSHPYFWSGFSMIGNPW